MSSLPLPPIIFPPITFPPPPPNPPPPPWSPPTHKPAGGVFAGVSIAAGIILFLITCIYTLIRGHRQSAAEAAAEAAALGLPPPAAAPDQPRRPSATAAGLPSFTYDRSVKHNVTGGDGGEEAATCSVCLGAFQTGETVRLLPVCLHLYHVECIDPWLDAHSSCPICRTGTDPAVDGGVLPPV
ncbi:unnamed protein product [Urochloa humidicola]